MITPEQKQAVIDTVDSFMEVDQCEARRSSDVPGARRTFWVNGKKRTAREIRSMLFVHGIETGLIYKEVNFPGMSRNLIERFKKMVPG